MSAPVSGEHTQSCANRQPSLLVLGLGNPILGDDRVGLEVVRRLQQRLPEHTAVFSEASVGGIELLYVLEGFSHVLIIDALEPGKLPPGEVREIPFAELQRNYAPLTPHNANLCTCLEFGRKMELRMPEHVRVFAIGVCDPYTFSEKCTPQVEQAIPKIVDFVFDSVFMTGSWLAQKTTD